MLIAVEGCLGAGKTTVAKGLAAHRGCRTLLEAFELNPFLRAFYEDPIGTALETEFAFLLVHYHQLKAHTAAITNSEVVSDFHLGKDTIYADLNIRDVAVRALFDELYDLCQGRTPTPSILVCLSISTDLVIERIRQRSRDFEMDVDARYYAALNAAYDRFFNGYSGSKVQVDMDEWDFLADPAHYESLNLMIDAEVRSNG